VFIESSLHIQKVLFRIGLVRLNSDEVLLSDKLIQSKFHYYCLNQYQAFDWVFSRNKVGDWYVGDLFNSFFLIFARWSK